MGIKTSVMGALTLTVHAGGPLTAVTGRAYVLQANSAVTLPDPTLSPNGRVALIKAYNGAGPTVAVAGSGNLVTAELGSTALTDDGTEWEDNSRVEYQADAVANLQRAVSVFIVAAPPPVP